MARRQYEGRGITIHWDSERCIHSQLCVLGAPSVFDFDARPWVNADGAPADEAARVIDTCPSGALSYTRTDGAPNGRRGRRIDDDPAASIRSDDDVDEGTPRSLVLESGAMLPTITPLPDGPLMVDGPIALSRGGEREMVQRVTLCRCGQSQTKPHCDGSHARVGFRAEGSAPPPVGEHRIVIRSSAARAPQGDEPPSLA